VRGVQQSVLNKVSAIDGPTLDALGGVLEVGLKELAVLARDNHWKLRNPQVVMHRTWSDGPPTVSYEEEMVLDYGAIGRGSDYLKQNFSDALTTILQSDERLAAAFATSDYRADVEQSIRIAAAADALVDDFAMVYLRESESFDWNETAFERSMNGVRRFAESTTHSLVVRAPLLGFSMNADELTISDGAFIRPLKKEEYLKLESGNLYERQNRTISPFQWTPGRFVITLTVDVPIGADRYDESRAIVLRLHECLTAVRLVGEGYVYLGDIWLERISSQYGDSYDEVYVSDGWPRVNTGMNLEVDEVTTSLLAELFNGLTGVWAQGAKKSNRLFIPNSRFNMFFGRELVEDQFLDLAICLESLFTRSGESSELTDKISRRVGRLLGSTQDDRMEKASTVRKLYGLRSKLVHGEPVEADVLFENVRVLLRMVRDAIVLKIRDGWSVDSLEREMML
jgi:hypothetical protein